MFTEWLLFVLLPMLFITLVNETIVGYAKRDSDADFNE